MAWYVHILRAHDLPEYSLYYIQSDLCVSMSDVDDVDIMQHKIQYLTIAVHVILNRTDTENIKSKLFNFYSIAESP